MWRPGDRVVVRGMDWRVVRSTSFSDCEALDLAAERSAATRTLLLPFDRPKAARLRRPRVVSRRRWAHDVSAIVGRCHPYGGLQFCPPAIRLLPYQLEPALAVLRHGVLRLLVADDVGLGKTVEAGLIVREVVLADHLSRVLIVCPAGLRGQWARELESLFELQAIEADASWLRKRSSTLPLDVNPWSLPGVYLSSMDFVKRPEALRPLEDVRWDLVVIDEAHAATPASNRRAALDALARRSRRLVLLTATPHSGDEEQFAAVCALGGGEESPPLVIFRRSRADTPLGDAMVRRVVLPVRLTEAEHTMHALLDAYTARLWTESTQRGEATGELVATVLRKRALSSAASLALSIRRRLSLLAGEPPPPAQLSLPWDRDDEVVEDEAPDSVLGVRGWHDNAGEHDALAAIADAAGIAADSESKVRALLRLVRRIGEPAIVFSEYRDTAERLFEQVLRAGHRVRLLHGGLSALERRRVVAEFNGGGLVLMATDAASEGLNLHSACRVVVHFELPWTPSRLHQRCGRVNRIGQSRRVHEIALVGNHTAEQLVLAPLVRRAERSSAFSQTGMIDQLTESRVASLLIAGSPVNGSVCDTRTAVHFETVDLRDEGRIEAERLELLRRLERRHRGGHPSRKQSAVAITTLPRRSAAPPTGLPAEARATSGAVPGPPAEARAMSGAKAGLLAVLIVSLHEHRNGPFDRLVVTLACDVRGITWRRSARLLRVQVERVLRDMQPGIDSAVEPLVKARLATVIPTRSRAIARLRGREIEMQRELTSTARQLVQVGLFDRRAMRASAHHLRVVEALRDEREARLAAGANTGERVEASWEVRAVLVGGRP
jgi:superfamily II DNA or RNA helicase